KINAAGTALVYSTFLGGAGGTFTNSEYGVGVAVDASGNAYLTGVTDSTDFPTVNAFQAFQPSPGGWSAFVAKLDPTGSSLVYSTYLGGRANDYASGI